MRACFSWMRRRRSARRSSGSSPAPASSSACGGGYAGLADHSRPLSVASWPNVLGRHSALATQHAHQAAICTFLHNLIPTQARTKQASTHDSHTRCPCPPPPHLVHVLKPAGVHGRQVRTQVNHAVQPCAPAAAGARRRRGPRRGPCCRASPWLGLGRGHSEQVIDVCRARRSRRRRSAAAAIAAKAKQVIVHCCRRWCRWCRRCCCWRASAAAAAAHSKQVIFCCLWLSCRWRLGGRWLGAGRGLACLPTKQLAIAGRGSRGRWPPALRPCCCCRCCPWRLRPGAAAWRRWPAALGGCCCPCCRPWLPCTLLAGGGGNAIIFRPLHVAVSKHRLVQNALR